jgi:hypothetical protein
MEYERPEIIVSFDAAALEREAAVCVQYGPCTAVECGN